MQHWAVNIFTTLITLYALFGDDIRMLSFTKAADSGFYILTAICMFFFMLEIVLCSIAREGYFLGFYFWLDLIATLSLLLDIGWFWNLLTGQTQDITSSRSLKGSSTAKKSASIGTKAGRIARVIRLIRLIRIVKLYKNANTAMLAEEELLMDEN